jgi:hypothetical protein
MITNMVEIDLLPSFFLPFTFLPLYEEEGYYWERTRKDLNNKRNFF